MFHVCGYKYIDGLDQVSYVQCIYLFAIVPSQPDHQLSLSEAHKEARFPSRTFIPL